MTDMNLGMTERLKPLHERVARMVRDEIVPLDEDFLADIGRAGDRWAFTPRQRDIGRAEGQGARTRPVGISG
jgi:acyl-CoA dehydrogenase